jgi:hypothetical protein
MSMVMALAQRGKDRPLIISCFFGGQIHNVYPAVKGYECIFFSNSDQFRSLICSRGWKFRLVKTLPLATDYLQDSIQAKYIKFLQFFPEFQEFANREWIIYFDHTVFVRKSDLDWIRLHHHPDKCALVLRHLAADRTIWGEVEAASSQLRYAQAMPQTIEWLQGLVKSHSISLDCTVDATTLISYREPNRLRNLLELVYQETLRLGQPECQILWSALAQLFPDAIQRYAWNELDPLWRVPYQSRREKLRSIRERAQNRVDRLFSGFSAFKK